jgi:5-methylcytosine-specific restriction endonuclease McrA
MQIHLAGLDIYDTINTMPSVSINCKYCKQNFTAFQSRQRKYCSSKCFNKSGDAHRGKKHTEITRQRISNVQKINEKIVVSQFKKGHDLWNHPNVKKNWIKKGSKPTNWQGGVRTKSEVIKDDKRYKHWRLEVFKRDNFKCVICQSKNTIQADHIFAKVKYPEKAFDINNGRTLCEKCHKQTPNYGGKAVNYENPLC